MFGDISSFDSPLISSLKVSQVIFVRSIFFLLVPGVATKTVLRATIGLFIPPFCFLFTVRLFILHHFFTSSAHKSTVYSFFHLHHFSLR